MSKLIIVGILVVVLVLAVVLWITLKPVDMPPDVNDEGPPGDTDDMVPSDQPTRLRVKNNCAGKIFMGFSENIDSPAVGVEPGGIWDAPIPDEGLGATRFWTKTGCNSQGLDCDIGQSSPPCPVDGCQPPLDTKFEATWADVNESQTDTTALTVTWYNGSLVDGFSTPFRITPFLPEGVEYADCVGDICNVQPEDCPSNEDLSQDGKFPELANVDLRIKNTTGKVVGCMSPCKFLNYPPPWGLGIPESDERVRLFCCPEGVEPEECRGGPIERTKYVQYIHDQCRNSYSYSYDDSVGLHTCPSQTKMLLEFCPAEFYPVAAGVAAGVTGRRSVRRRPVRIGRRLT